MTLEKSQFLICHHFFLYGLGFVPTYKCICVCSLHEKRSNSTRPLLLHHTSLAPLHLSHLILYTLYSLTPFSQVRLLQRASQSQTTPHTTHPLHNPNHISCPKYTGTSLYASLLRVSMLKCCFRCCCCRLVFKLLLILP